MFDELLNIKKFREQGAANAVLRAKAFVSECEAAVAEAEAEVAAHHEFRLAEEVRLFDEIRGQAVKVEAIDAMKFRIAQMRAKEEDLNKAVEEKRTEVGKAKAAVVQAEAGHREAQKAVQKFEEFVARQHEAEAKAAMAREEGEVEEVSEAIFASRLRKTEE